MPPLDVSSCSDTSDVNVPSEEVLAVVGKYWTQYFDDFFTTWNIFKLVSQCLSQPTKSTKDKSVVLSVVKRCEFSFSQFGRHLHEFDVTCRDISLHSIPNRSILRCDEGAVFGSLSSIIWSWIRPTAHHWFKILLVLSVLPPNLLWCLFSWRLWSGPHVLGSSGRLCARIHDARNGWFRSPDQGLHFGERSRVHRLSSHQWAKVCIVNCSSVWNSKNQ
jgi:hypothetical protein